MEGSHFMVTRCDGMSYELAWRDYQTNSVVTHFEGPYEDAFITCFLAISGVDILGVLQVDTTYGEFKAAGTMVRPAYRKKGIATALWSYALTTLRPSKVTVSTVSDRGFTLIESLKKKFPRITWKVFDDGQRSGRRLKKRTRRSAA